MPRARSVGTCALAAALGAGALSCRAEEPPLARFSVAPRAERVRFVAIGDTGKSEVGLSKTAERMRAHCALAGCDFAVLLGDLIYPRGALGDDDPAIERLVVRPFATLGVPVFGVIGNHDEGGGFYPERASHLTRLPEGAPRVRRSFSLDAGPVTVVGVDTAGAMFGRPVARRAVARALDEAAGFRVAVGHHPRRSRGRHGDAGAYDGLPSFFPVASGHGVRSLLDDAVCGRADLYLSGHDHSLQWLADPCRGTALVVSGAGSEATAVAGETRAHFAASELGFVAVDAGASGARIDLIRHDGEILYSRVLPARSSPR